MPIDDRLAQAKAQVESDERQRSAGREIVKELVRLCKSLPVLKAMIAPVEPLLAIFEFFQRHQVDNVRYLVDVVIEEVQEHAAKLEALSEKHRRFIENEWPDLMRDGVTKAQQARAKQRVQRLGKILAYAYVEGEKKSADLTEEMMRVALGLDDDDVTVLDWLCEGMMESYVRGNKTIDFEVANDFWHDVEERIRLGFGKGPALPQSMNVAGVMTCLAKLQAFGLVLQVRQNPGKTFSTLPYSPLDRGYEFVEYLRTQN